ncbi:AAA family ATPase [Candidatus Uhrbacteria bacterium]|nr:AAA family ATPase [Candidatus Uhrbacteria bacterium]
MYLRRLEIQGFKTVAVKTVLEFKPDTDGRRGMTAIIGPNGSGKSNIADAMRWVMGEQSMKMLRAKKSEDVIFSGTPNKPRAGFAEVSLTLVNDDKPEIEMSEIVITRRLYRDGEAEYLVNNQLVRLSDVVLLLANCGIGQRTYSVIGQGMVDAVLVASPSERKEFFDEASGLRPFQLKRNASANKLEHTRENLKQADVLLREIEPRLVALERQVTRLQEREGIEQELLRIEKAYFGKMWSEIRARLDVATLTLNKEEADYLIKAKEFETLEVEFASMEKAAPMKDGVSHELRNALDGLREERSKLRERQIRLESKRELAKVVSAQKPWSPLPLSKIILEIESLQQTQHSLFTVLEAENPDLDKARELIQVLRLRNTDLLAKLQQPAPEPVKTMQVDPELEVEMAQLLRDMQEVTEKMAATEQRIQAASKQEDEGRTAVFAIQHKLNAKRHEAQQIERRLADARIEMARLETRRDGCLAEIRQYAPSLEADLSALSETPDKDLALPVEQLQSKMQKLRTQLEWIGGIDPETVTEHATTKQRFEELTHQTDDLKAAMLSLETIIEELDRSIKERGDAAFERLNKEFGLYFKKLFGGGDAQLLKVLPDIAQTGEEDEDAEDASEGRVVKAGIDIQATPPGKRLKSIALLSGGERALTSIALICAIMAINPSPFVVLDEVDAALDDANSRKFAEIIDQLSHRTQFVVVTHNRNTMHKANVLYGITMGDDGISQLLSVSLDSYQAA